MSNISTEKIESPKFNQIVETATELFSKYGVKRVTVEEICSTAKISKMTFYKYFGNKIELGEYIIFNILDEAQTEFDNLCNQVNSFSEKIDQFLKMKMNYAKRFSKEFYLDFINLSPKIQKRVISYSQENQKQFLELIKHGQETGEVRKDINLKFITYMLNHLKELGKKEELFEFYDNIEEMTMDMTRFYFYGIMGKK